MGISDTASDTASDAAIDRDSRTAGRAPPITWWPASLRARLTLWYTVLLAVPLIVFALASYIAAARALEQRTDVFIGDALTAFSREVVAERRTMMSALTAIQSTVREVRFRDLQIAVLDTARRVFRQNRHVPAPVLLL